MLMILTTLHRNTLISLENANQTQIYTLMPNDIENHVKLHH